jgi:predicted HTH domain antitoxin
MPLKARQKAKNDSFKEGHILLAISAIQKDVNGLSIGKAAHLYDVPWTTLRDRLNGRLLRSEKRANGH